ncbi:MAG: hypothetical protein ABIC19_02980 [Patescibacteria group bacterium]|nr:hypothetical protein [Patescibacteria group bacterium]
MNFSSPAGPNQNPSQSADQPANDKIRVLLVVLLIIIISVALYFLFIKKSALSSTAADDTIQGDSSQTLTSTAADGQTAARQNPIKTSASEDLSGIYVSNLFIPSAVDTEAVKFLKSLEGQGQLPIEINEGELGKPNPFNNQ